MVAAANSVSANTPKDQNLLLHDADVLEISKKILTLKTLALSDLPTDQIFSGSYSQDRKHTKTATMQLESKNAHDAYLWEMRKRKTCL